MAKRKATRPTLPEIMKHLEIELRHLRGLVKEIYRNCAVKLEAQIEQAADDLLRQIPEAPGAAGLRRRESLMKSALSLIGALRVKPEKGRYRDVKRMHTTVDELSALGSRMQ
jgi:hypothetical protein